MKATTNKPAAVIRATVKESARYSMRELSSKAARVSNAALALLYALDTENDISAQESELCESVYPLYILARDLLDYYSEREKESRDNNPYAAPVYSNLCDIVAGFCVDVDYIYSCFDNIETTGDYDINAQRIAHIAFTIASQAIAY